MANYNISATSGSASTPQQIATDKVRVASTTNIYITSGDANIAADDTCPIVLAGAVERSFYVGANNYVSILAVTSSGVASITELGTDGVL